MAVGGWGLPGGVRPEGVSASAWGGSAPVHAGICLPGGGQLGGGCLPFGVSAQGGVSAPVHAGIHTVPVNRMTDTRENITFPQLRCGR